METTRNDFRLFKRYSLATIQKFKPKKHNGKETYMKHKNMCVLKSQITKSDMKSQNLRLYPIH